VIVLSGRAERLRPSPRFPPLRWRDGGRSAHEPIVASRPFRHSDLGACPDRINHPKEKRGLASRDGRCRVRQASRSDRGKRTRPMRRCGAFVGREPGGLRCLFTERLTTSDLVGFRSLPQRAGEQLGLQRLRDVGDRCLAELVVPSGRRQPPMSRGPPRPASGWRVRPRRPGAAGGPSYAASWGPTAAGTSRLDVAAQRGACLVMDLSSVCRRRPSIGGQDGRRLGIAVGQSM
jgi:hypothetical protein